MIQGNKLKMLGRLFRVGNLVSIFLFHLTIRYLTIKKYIKKTKFMNRIVITLLLLSLFRWQAFSQNKTIKLVDVTIKEALEILEKEYPKVTFAYNANVKELNEKITNKFSNKTLDEILKKILYSNGLSYKRKGEHIVILKKNRRTKKYTISGYVYDKSNKETLVGCAVYAANFSTGTTTNSYGFYSLTLEEGETDIYVSYLGYANKKEKIVLNNNLRYDISVEPSSYELSEVKVQSHQSMKEREYAGVTSISPRMMKELPLPLGEPDILKVVQLQNGVKTISDGSSAYYVRGGNKDQNLVIVDEASLYNPSHVLGIVSVINHEVIKNADFYKGYIPAKYSGMASSVMDVTTKEGNMEKMAISGGISTLGARAIIEGPLVKDKLSYMISGRKSWFSLIKKGAPEYYDINSKIHWKVSDNNKLFFSFYHGNDQITGDNNGTRWSNTLGNIRWNHVFNGKLFLNTSLVYNKFHGVNVTDMITKREWENGIEEIQFKSALDYYLNDKNRFTFSLQAGKHDFLIGRFKDRGVDIGTRENLSYTGAVTHHWDVTDKLSVEYGLSFKHYRALGPVDLIELDENKDYKSSFKSESGTYKQWNSFEPRVNVNYNINEQQRLFASYSKLQQFVHSLDNYENDYDITKIWVPVSNNIDPIKTNVYSLGYNYSNKKIGINVEGFFKDIENQLDYITYPDLYNVQFEKHLRSGSAKAYGIELGLRYNLDKWKFMADYCYSRVFLTVPGVSNGREYIAPYDIPHQLSLTTLFKLNRRWQFSAIWKYSTGRPFTLPVGQQVVYNDYQRHVIPVFGDRYNARGKDYHRLDLMATLLPNPKKNRRWKGTWKFGLSNAYGRKNPVSYSYKFQESNLSVVQTSIFGFLPMIEYSFKF